MRTLLAPLLFAALLLPPGAHPAALELQPYEFKTASGTIAAELGQITVPQRHDRPDGATFTLSFVRLPRLGKARSPELAPVVYLAGGPGGSGIEAGRGPRLPVFQAVQQYADIILLDQRGTGRSDPPPPCPEKFEPAPDRLGEAEQFAAQLNAMARTCAGFWQNAGVDLGAYTTLESAHDLEDLRRALKVPKLNLWGMSYGTHLALATLRAHQSSIERVVLMGTEGLHQTLKPPLQADRLLQRLSAALPESADNRALAGRVARVFARLLKEPVVVEFAEGSGMPPKVALSAFDLQLAAVLGLATTGVSRDLPEEFAELERGNFQRAAVFVLQTRARLGMLSAMPLAMDTASGASPQRLAQIRKEARQSVFGAALNFPFPEIGVGIGVKDLGENFRAALKTSVPTLFISGTLDGRTPPENAEEVRRGFAHSAHLILDGAGHDNELFLAAPDLGVRIADFFVGKPAADETLRTPLW